MVIQGVSPLYSNLFSYSVLFSILIFILIVFPFGIPPMPFWYTPHSLLVDPLYRFGIPTLQLIMQKRIPYTI